MSADELRARVTLSDAELKAIEKVVANMGLGLGMDVSQWCAYRETVPANFRLRLPYGMRMPEENARPSRS